jgi:hypothetical protein
LKKPSAIVAANVKGARPHRRYDTCPPQPLAPEGRFA